MCSQHLLRVAQRVWRDPGRSGQAAQGVVVEGISGAVGEPLQQDAPTFRAGAEAADAEVPGPCGAPAAKKGLSLYDWSKNGGRSLRLSTQKSRQAELERVAVGDRQLDGITRRQRRPGDDRAGDKRKSQARGETIIAGQCRAPSKAKRQGPGRPRSRSPQDNRKPRPRPQKSYPQKLHRSYDGPLREKDRQGNGPPTEHDLWLFPGSPEGS